MLNLSKAMTLLSLQLMPPQRIEMGDNTANQRIGDHLIYFNMPATQQNLTFIIRTFF
jgi:hypothetical protein